MGRQRLAAYARMAELLHSTLRAETPGAALELPPVVLLTAAGVVRGKVTSIWGYLSRIQTLKPEAGPSRAAVEAMLTDPGSQVAGPVALNRIRTIYLVDVSVSPPGTPELWTHLGQLSVSLDEVVAWTLDTGRPQADALEAQVEAGSALAS